MAYSFLHVVIGSWLFAVRRLFFCFPFSIVDLLGQIWNIAINLVLHIYMFVSSARDFVWRDRR